MEDGQGTHVRAGIGSGQVLSPVHCREGALADKALLPPPSQKGLYLHPHFTQLPDYLKLPSEAIPAPGLLTSDLIPAQAESLPKKALRCWGGAPGRASQRRRCEEGATMAGSGAAEENVSSAVAGAKGLWPLHPAHSAILRLAESGSGGWWSGQGQGQGGRLGVILLAYCTAAPQAGLPGGQWVWRVGARPAGCGNQPLPALQTGTWAVFEPLLPGSNPLPPGACY